MLKQIEAGLKAHFPAQLVDKLLEAHQDAKHNFYLGSKLRLSEVEAGRFCEAAFRMLQHARNGNFTALGRPLDTETIIKEQANIPHGQKPESIRLHIPRALRVVYDVRNNRDAAHLGAGDVDPNLQDATLVVSVLDWVLAEFVRLYHGVPAAEAQRIVDSLVARKVPAVQDFNGFLKVQRPKAQVSGYVLLVLYERGTAGATYDELQAWVKPSMRRNLRRTLGKMVHDDAFLHEADDRFYLTRLGQAEVERKNLHHVE